MALWIIFGTEEELLNRESLLKDFKLSDEDIKIDFDKISSDLYKIDLEEANENEYRPSFTKIEDNLEKDPISEYILAKPKENQITDITHQMMQIIGNMYPIPDQEIKVYIGRILNSMSTEQLRDILLRKWSYTDKIKAHIRKLSDSTIIYEQKNPDKKRQRLNQQKVENNTKSIVFYNTRNPTINDILNKIKEKLNDNLFDSVIYFNGKNLSNKNLLLMNMKDCNINNK